ncbi:MAG: 3-hydroxylacyl-ACP dehydratase [Rhodoferax sp.]|nr:3-hydroxylacyl-ACP dehydratase [Rhodoferax sp.]
MCLLDTVLAWSEQHIVCETASHFARDHPLRNADRLGAVSGVEYAAQAMAVHGALLTRPSSPPSQGYLTSVRSLNLQVQRLDDLDGPLQVSAERLSGDERLVLYQFRLHHAGRCLMDGRASVVLDRQTL